MVGFYGSTLQDARQDARQHEADDNSDSEWERITETMRAQGGEATRLTARECRRKFNELIHQYKLFRVLLQMPRARYDAAAHTVFLDDQDWDRVLASCTDTRDIAFYHDIRAGGSFAHVEICSQIEDDGVARADAASLPSAARAARTSRSKRRPLPSRSSSHP